MKITILCTNRDHPIFEEIERWSKKATSFGHIIDIAHDKHQLVGGDFLFLLSCSQKITKEIRQKYKFNLLLHASNLPEGRGWSPHIWSILNGENKITVSLLEVSDPIDSGDVWKKIDFNLIGHELLPEINKKLFEVEFLLIEYAINNYQKIKPQPQNEFLNSPLLKRGPDDSRLDPEKSIANQFNLLRVVDNERYPAFFDFNGYRYLVKIEKTNN